MNVADSYVNRLLEIDDDWFSEEADEILENLVKIGQPAVQPIINKYLAHPQIYYLDEYTYQLGDVLREIGESAVITLISTLESDNLHLRANVARILGQIGDEKAIEPLAREARETGSYAAVYALGDIGGDRAAQILMNLLQREDIKRDSIILWLGKTGSDHVLPILVEALDDPDPEICWIAVCSLKDLNHHMTVELLVTKLNDPSPRVRSTAAHILAKDYRDFRAADVLAEDLNHGISTMRAGTAKALGMIGANEYADELERLMREDTDMQVRLSAASGLIELNVSHVKDAEKLVSTSLLSQDAGTRFHAIYALRDVRNEKVVNWLLPLLHDTNPFHRYCIVQVLSEHHSARITNALRDRLEQETHRLVRKAIIKALQKIK